MTNSPDDTTVTQQQRLQASQLPIDPVKIKAMIDYYIAEYREQLLDRDLLEQTVAEDEMLWDINIWKIVARLTTALRQSNCDPYSDSYFDEQTITECRRFATDLLRDLQKISKDIPGLAAKLPKIKQDVWEFLDVIMPNSQPTQAMRSSTLELQRDESGAVSLQTIPADLEPQELFHQRYREYIKMGDAPDGAARLQELRESLNARIAAARDMQRNDIDWPFYHLLGDADTLHLRTQDAHDFTRICTIASLCQEMAYRHFRYNPATTTPSQDREVSQYISSAQREMRTIIELLLEFDDDGVAKAQQLEQYVISPYIRAEIDAEYVIHGKDPDGTRQARASTYVIAPEDEEYTLHPVVNSLNDRRFIFDQRIRDAYITIITKHPAGQSSSQLFDDYYIVSLCAKHGEQAVARKAAWDRVNYYFYQTDEIEEIHFYVLLLKDELGEAERVKQWVAQQFRDNPNSELATLYFECIGYDYDVFRFLQEATAREATSPIKALDQQVENLNTLESTVSKCLYNFVEKQEAAEEQWRLHAESA
ncbi:MAG: hypothetical protein Q4B27_03515 [Candidatus Saccharibacteria bacterium]|nr:hypothetical protein [Candidatus Saccharibacteria bacterium]